MTTDNSSTQGAGLPLDPHEAKRFLEAAATGTPPTAGEWSVGWDTTNDVLSVGVHETWQIIRLVSPFLKVNDEDKVNARLIAAAKDFFDACTEERLAGLEAVLRFYMTVPLTRSVAVAHRSGGTCSNLQGLLSDLHAARAKATGEPR